MRFRIQNILIQTNDTRLAENQIEILQRLRRPVALHAIHSLWLLFRDIVERRIRYVRLGRILDSAKHPPRPVLQRLITCDAVKNED